MKKIFISHSSKDKLIVEQLIDVIELIGVKNNSIFCSSFEGYGVELGENFLDRIKNEINEEVIMILILSKNYYESTICICEMGAAWVKTDKQIPFLIPPFDYNDAKGVIPLIHGMKANEREKYNSFKKLLEEFFQLEPIDFSVWERKRNNIIEAINELINKKQSSFEDKSSKTHQHKAIEINDYYENRDEEIKQRAKIEWPDNFEMQVHYIKGQKEAIQDLIKLHPADIDEYQFNEIRKQGRLEWPNSFDMQLYHEKNQIESIRKLKSM
jgi:TIR domain